MSFISLIIFILLLVAGSLANDGNTTLSCFLVERNALLKFKASFSDPSRKLLSWTRANMDCCKWQGVQCDKVTSHVITVDLRNEEFYNTVLKSEKLDSSIMELKHLRVLDLSGNDFQLGYIPASIGTLNQLQYLNLSYANFSGFVPHQLGNLSQLSVLDLSGENTLIMDDFMWMFRLSSLTHLDMTYVNLTSTKDILKVLNTLPSIVSLSLQTCRLGNENLQNAFVTNSATLPPTIRYLDLSDNHFDGEFPGFFENMTSLTYLDLSYNSFQWGTNSFIFTQNNCNLEYLNLGSNSLSGDISNFFRLNSSKCLDPKLANLDLSYTNLYGQLPGDVGWFTKLESLYLIDNQLSGPIPTSICNLSAMKVLNLYGNILNGSIRSCFGNLTSQQRLDLTNNQLSGKIPTSLGQLQNLKFLRIGRNYFHGTISKSHLANLSKLQILDIRNDLTKLRVRSDWTPPFQLTQLSTESCENEGGQFPKWLQLQKELISLTMSNCNISEAIPDWFRYRNLNELDLSNNRIEGTLPESLCEMSYLATLDLSRNRLSGTLPECLVNLSSLIGINLSQNRFSGVIPNSIGGASSLLWLKLSDNNFTGEFPSSLRNCTQLKFLDIGHNKIPGRLPKWIGIYFLRMEYLGLSGNDFYGIIPLELCQLSMLKILELDNNKLTGNIPGCFGNFTNMAGYPFPSRLARYRVGIGMQAVTKGSEMEYYEMLKYVILMDLSNNDLVGEVPLELTRLVALRSLNLSHNHLHGIISDRIGDMKLLESLDLSNNNLFGSIPASLSDLDSLGFLNLSHNNLSGEIPTGRHLQTLDNPWNYEGNPRLCGALLKKCNVDKSEGTPSEELSQTDEEVKIDRIWFYGVVISGFATGFWGAIGVLLFKRGWRFAYFRFVDDIIERICG